jgi:hypothetical protein
MADETTQTTQATDPTRMLEELMRYVNNRFDRDPDGSYVGAAEGAFSVSSGALSVDGLANGQWFWVEGSALNDGLHRYPDTGMSDESFEGRVVFLRVPRNVVELAAEIQEWCDANSDAIGGPYQSESFGGYSYQKAQGGSQGNETPAAAWQLQFGARLRPFRKLSRDWV